MSTTSDKAIDILRATSDGDNLAPPDLKLVEMAVNHQLNEAGEAAFDELHRNAMKPEGYTKPWFCGIQHMTRDHTGHVYWKGIVVEHYDHDFWRTHNWKEQMKQDAEELARRCRLLERINQTPTVRTAVLRWEEEWQQLAEAAQPESEDNHASDTQAAP
jgi:hypothetical protein